MSKKACLIVALVVAVLFVPHFAFAADPPPAPSTDPDQIVKDLANFLAVMIRFLNSLLWPFLIILGDLMDVDMIIGPGMEGRMIDIYNQVRSLVNIAFVLVLIAVAFYNVLGLGGGEGELAIKTALPKVVLGLILVNFTLPIGRVLLDVTNVGTNIAFGLPNIVEGYDFAPELENFTNEVCFKGKDPTSTTGAMIQYSSKEADKSSVPIQTQFLCADTNEDDKYDALNSIISTTYFSDLNKNNLGLIMAVNMGKIGSLGLLKEGTISSFEDLTVNMIFATLMFLVFATSYIVMGIVLLTRIVILWIALALSPIAVLAYVVPQVKEWAGGGGDFGKKVIKHLISPIIMGVTLSFGYLLMDAWNNTAGSSNALGSLAVNNVISAQFLVSGIDDLPKLILAIASIVVVWTGTFAAASDTFAQGITDGIKGFGDQVKSFAMALPMSLPTVGLGVKGEASEGNVSPMALLLAAQSQMSNVSGGGMAMSQLQKLPADTKFLGLNLNPNSLSNSPTAVRSELRSLTADINGQAATVDPEKAARLADRILHALKDDSSLKGSAKDTAISELTTAMNNIQANKEEGLTSLRTILDKHKGNKELGLEEKEVTSALGALVGKTLARPTASTSTGPTGSTGHGGTATAPAAVATAAGQLTPSSPAPTAVAALNTGLGALAPAATPAETAARATTTAAVTKLTSDIAAAKTALDTLQTTYNPANLADAKAKVQKATTGAHALQTDATIAADPTLLGHVTTAHTALNGMNTTIAALTPPTP